MRLLKYSVLAASAALVASMAVAPSAQAAPVICGSEIQDYTGSFTGTFTGPHNVERNLTIQFEGGNTVHTFSTATKGAEEYRSFDGNFGVFTSDSDSAIGFGTPVGTVVGKPLCTNGTAAVDSIQGQIYFPPDFNAPADITLQRPAD